MLFEGGSVTNGSATITSASIAGGTDGVQIMGALGSVQNYGKIAGTRGDGVSLLAGGVVDNGSPADEAASISGGAIGVNIDGGSGTVNNFGTVTGALDGVFLRAGGAIANGSTSDTTASITGGEDGVAIAGNSGSIQNYGTIKGDSVGIAVAATDTTVTNSGTVSGSSVRGDAVLMSGANDRLVVLPGSHFVGRVVGSGVSLSSTLELAAGSTPGTLTGLGDRFTGFSNVTVDTGAQWSLAGTNWVYHGETLTNQGTITLAHTLDSLNVEGTVAGSGTFQVNDGSTIRLNNGNAALVLDGTGDRVFLGGVINADMKDFSYDLALQIGPMAGTDEITGFGVDRGSVVDLVGGVGGYHSVSDVVAALHSDGHGGTMLALGTGSIDFVGLPVGELTAANFKIV